MTADLAYAKFQGLMADFAAFYMGPSIEAMKKPGNARLERPTDRAFTIIFYGFTEITSSLDAIKLSEQLVGVAPPRSRRINKDHYIQFLVGAYLQEMYILEQRLSAYAKKISRLYKSPSLPGAIRRIVYEPLEGIINTRGAHVHSQRYSDEHLDAVATMALFRRVKHQYGDDLEFEYMSAQREWKKRIASNNAVVIRIVDQYFKVLNSIMCRGGKICFPARS